VKEQLWKIEGSDLCTVNGYYCQLKLMIDLDSMSRVPYPKGSLAEKIHRSCLKDKSYLFFYHVPLVGNLCTPQNRWNG